MSVHRPTYLLFVVWLSALAVVHFIFSKFYLYWVYPWLDIPAHLLGGIVVAIGFLALRYEVARAPLARGLPIALAAVLAVGLAGEAYEALVGVTWFEAAPLADTALDVLMDLVGGAAGYAMVRLRVSKSEV